LEERKARLRGDAVASGGFLLPAVAGMRGIPQKATANNGLTALSIIRETIVIQGTWRRMAQFLSITKQYSVQVFCRSLLLQSLGRESIIKDAIRCAACSRGSAP
jgi:hypothetical protein